MNGVTEQNAEFFHCMTAAVNAKVHPHKLFLRSVPLHPSQEEIKAADKYVDFKYILEINHELVLKIMSMGMSAEVLEPDTLRNDMLKEISIAEYHYKKGWKKDNSEDEKQKK
jgi:predicted DNA-binding transcriptional regulator YafY